MTNYPTWKTTFCDALVKVLLGEQRGIATKPAQLVWLEFSDELKVLISHNTAQLPANTAHCHLASQQLVWQAEAVGIPQDAQPIK